MLTQCLKAFLLSIAILTASSNAAEFATMPNRKPKVETPKVEEKVVEIEPPKPSKPKPEKKVVPKPEKKVVPKPEVKKEVLPEPEVIEEPKAEPKLDPHVKIVIHSAPWCKYCPDAIAEANKLKDEYEVVVKEHNNGFYTDYGYYINSFPYIEYYYDGRVQLYNYGKRTEAQLRRTIESLK